jgi:hypothetical protein
MGLAEKRRIRDVQEKHGPRFQAELDAALGFKVPFEIDIATLPEDKTVLDCYDYYFESYGPGLVVKVLKDVCADAIGKETVQTRIKKIIFQNTARSATDSGEKEVRLEGDTLFVRESFYGYSDKLYGEDDLRAAIENKL